MGMEDDLGWEYFGSNPMKSPQMMEHMNWHKDPANQQKKGNYGERFLNFHRDFINKFDDFRRGKGLFPVSAWDPSTPIPPDFAHTRVISGERTCNDNPYGIDPYCKTPSWATEEGGTETAPPHYNYTKLSQFQTLDELGLAIDSGWHVKVHDTIGGDMKMMHYSPIDPIFWRWHRWIDNIRVKWKALQMPSHINQFNRVSAIVNILFGAANYAPKVVISQNSITDYVSGVPDNTLWTQLSPISRDALINIVMRELGALHSNIEFRKEIQQITAIMLNQNISLLFNDQNGFDLDSEAQLQQ